MDIRTLPDHAAMSRAAADWLARRLRAKPDSLLCLATGGTPERTYELLARQPALLRRARLLKLDEWGGLARTDPATCEAYLQRLLVRPLGRRQTLHGFRCRPRDPEAECGRVNAWIKANGPIDLCVLGLGVNGHLGFNEPAAALQPFAHVAKLSAASLKHGMLSAARERPTYGLTLGMANLLASREILLVVSGSHKRTALPRLLRGDVTTRFPATFLRLHPRVTLLADQAAMPRSAFTRFHGPPCEPKSPADSGRADQSLEHCKEWEKPAR
jgi:galactosamine-6-phosphate isomerase